MIAFLYQRSWMATRPPIATRVPAKRLASDEQERDRGIEPPEIVGVAGDEDLGGPARADDDVAVDDVSGHAGGQQEARRGGVGTVERNEIGARLSDEPGDPRLASRAPDHLSQ